MDFGSEHVKPPEYHSGAYVWVGATAEPCPDPGPYLLGNSLAVGNRHPTQSVWADVRATMSGTNVYQDHNHVVVPPNQYVVLVTCPINPTTNQYQSLTVLATGWV
jgi:hypothetical protein